MNSRYGQTITFPLPLCYDPSIYWIDPYLKVDCRVSLDVERDVRVSALLHQEMIAQLSHATLEVVRGKWVHYATTERTYDNDQGYYRTYERRIYECIGFRDTQTYLVPYIPTLTRRTLSADANTTIDLVVRSLMWYDRRMFGALHPETHMLYLFETA